MDAQRMGSGGGGVGWGVGAAGWGTGSRLQLISFDHYLLPVLLIGLRAWFRPVLPLQENTTGRH